MRKWIKKNLPGDGKFPDKSQYLGKHIFCWHAKMVTKESWLSEHFGKLYSQNDLTIQSVVILLVKGKELHW